MLAIGPAVATILWRGERSADDLLILSQVILSLQLSFAVIPLVHFTSDRRKMGVFATPLWGRVLAWIAAVIILALNVKLVLGTIAAGLEAGHFAVRYVLLPVTVLLAPLLAWMLFEPIWRGWRGRRRMMVPTPILSPLESSLAQQYGRIALALEASPQDGNILAGVIPLLRTARAEVLLIHVVESATARFIGTTVDDEEARHDADYLERVAGRLREAGMNCVTKIGAGDPSEEIARIAEEEHVDLIVAGSHGHRLLGDLFHGSTVSELRHLTSLPILTIRTSETTLPASIPATTDTGLPMR